LDSFAKIDERLVRRIIFAWIEKQLILGAFIRDQRHIGSVISKDVIKGNQAAERADVGKVLQQVPHRYRCRRIRNGSALKTGRIIWRERWNRRPDIPESPNAMECDSIQDAANDRL